jgi:transcriptional regulator with XRE-family HTH domain
MKGHDLKAWRSKTGYSQTKLANVLDIDVMTVSRWERDVRSIPPFLHLALKWLEKEGGEPKAKGKSKPSGYPMQEEKVYTSEKQSSYRPGRVTKTKKERR